MAVGQLAMALLPYALKAFENKGNSVQRLLQPKFQGTNYGRRLKQHTEQGNLTPGQEANIIGQTARTAGRQSALSTSRYAGELINRGQFGSVSAQRGLREADADVRRTVADTSRGIYQSEETAKTQAKDTYAQALDRDKAERRNAKFNLATGLAMDAGKQYADYKGLKTRSEYEANPSRVNKDWFQKMTEQQKIDWWESLKDEDKQYFLPYVTGEWSNK